MGTRAMVSTRRALVRFGLVAAVVTVAGFDGGVFAQGASPTGPAPAGLDIPLTIHDVAGVERTREVCSTGVPLPCGLLKAPEGIAVYDAAGKPVPAQFRVLERWREGGLGASDLSVKWLLVTFLADVPRGGKAVYRLKAGTNPAPVKPVKVEETADAFRMGGLTFARDFSGPFQLVLTDPDGKTLTAADLPVTWRVWENGPVRACLKAETPTVPGQFGFIAWIYAYTGQRRWDLTVVLKNTPNTPRGPFYFKDFSVVWGPPELKGARDYMLGGEWGKVVKGAAPAYLYQASDGTDRWENFESDANRATAWWNAIVMDWTEDKVRAKAGTPRFRGYKVFVGGEEKGAGNFAAGWAALSGGGSGAMVAVRNFHEQYPKALEVAPGRLVARLWPKYGKGYGGLHWLDDCQRKWHDLSFRLSSKPLSAADAEAASKALDYPLLAHAPAEWYLQTGVIGRAPSRHPPKNFAGEVVKAQKGTGRNWVTFGGDLSDRIRRRYHGADLRPFVLTGNPHSAYRLHRTAMHSAGMTPFWVDDYRYPRDKGLIRWGYCSPPRATGTYRPGTWHHGYMAWNNSHFCCQEIFDTWRLMGDPLALEAAKDLATYCQFVADFRDEGGGLGAGTRSDGLPFHNLCEAYRLTGEEAFMASMRRFAGVCWNQVDKHRGNYGVMGSWEGGKDKVEKPFMMGQVVQGLCSYYELTADERTLDQILGMLDFILAEATLDGRGWSYVVKLDPGQQEPYRKKTLEACRKAGNSSYTAHLSPRFAWLHKHTGEPRFRTVIDNIDPKPYPHIDCSYLTHYSERPDKQPPDPVKDLKAEALGGGRVRLTWTASAGEPVRYQVKWANKPMVRRITWSEQSDIHANWWAANNVDGEPKPAAAGTAQSMVVEGVTPGTRHFAIRSFDAASNRSAMSAMARVEVR